MIPNSASPPLFLFRAMWGRVWRVAEALEYGIVSINVGVFSNEVAPFGGVKESGRRGAKARNTGSDDYLEIKFLFLWGDRLRPDTDRRKAP